MEVAEYSKMDEVEKNHWWFVAKRRYLAAMLARFTPSATRPTILDIGCGTGAIMEFVASLGYKVEGIDLTEEALRHCREKNLSVKLGRAEQIPYPDNSFDIIIASDVLEHVLDDAAAVREVGRVLRPGGRFIATVPAHQALFSYHDKALHHVRRYGKKQFARTLGAHLTLEYISWIHAAILLPAAFLRLVARSRNASGESDVKPTPAFINKGMKLVYALEFAWFKLFKTLPFGLSLMAVARKED